MDDAHDAVDVAFRLAGGRLAVDHAWALFGAVSAALPWFAGERAARLHQVHTAASGSGWQRPGDAAGDELHLSRRTRLVLRVPRRRAADALVLAGSELDVGGYRLAPGEGRVRELAPAATLLARHVACEDGEEEARLVARLERTLGEIGSGGAEVLCGRAQRITTPDGVLHTRSVVIANLDDAGSLTVQRRGIGPAGHLGCGVFVPFKRIE
ncbi:MAG: type I-MYXAN CRISPR-associated protein Cas6/Cmx6 [Gammaproteobacteria bacterium]|nr:type I-MYXAN CRISPR-associated protein Cas6/Cmx6 [Gammaproteobacteria bacterium]